MRVRELTFQTCSYNFKIVKFCTWWPVLPASQVSLDWSTGRRFLSSPHPSSTSISAESPARAPIGRPASRDRASSSDWRREKQITEILRRSSRNIYLWNSFATEANAPLFLSHIFLYIYIIWKCIFFGLTKIQKCYFCSFYVIRNIIWNSFPALQYEILFIPEQRWICPNLWLFLYKVFNVFYIQF